MDKLEEEFARAIATKCYAVIDGSEDCGDWEEMSPRAHMVYREAAQACDVIARKQVQELEAAIRETAERLSIESQIAAPTPSECSLRAKMGHCASDLFAALHRKGVEPMSELRAQQQEKPAP